YYAGHGHLEEKIVGGRGYWVPVNGERDNPTTWISTVTITDFLDLMSAKHVLVVADSCYAGALFRAGLEPLETGKSDEARRHWLTAMAQQPSRTILASGGLKPVLDSGSGGHSVFAKAFLDVLNTNDDVLEGRQLYDKIAKRVLHMAEAYGVKQQPLYNH